MMKKILTVLLIAFAVSVVADEQKMTGLPSPDDVFVIAVAPHSPEMKGYFTPDSLLETLPKLVPSDVRLSVDGSEFWQSGVIVLKDKTVIFWRTSADWFIAVDGPIGRTFYSLRKEKTPNKPSEATR